MNPRRGGEREKGVFKNGGKEFRGGNINKDKKKYWRDYMLFG